MASRFSRTFFAQVTRPAVRASWRNAGRRMMSAEAKGKPDSDLPWIIGSAAVFGPAALYLLSPSKKKAHHPVEKASPKTQEPEPVAAPAPAEPLPVKDDEGTEVPAAEVQASTQAAFNADSPKDAQDAEEGKGTTPAEASASAEEAATDVPAAAKAEPEQKESTESHSDAPADASGEAHTEKEAAKKD